MNSDTQRSQGTLWSTQWHVGQWRGGDPEALGRLALRFSPLVRYRIQSHRAFGRLKQLASVDDIEQEVWARVLRSGPDSFVPTGVRHAFISWLGQIVDSSLVDLLRQSDALKRGGGRDPEVLDSLAEIQRLRRPGQISVLSPSGEARVAEFEDIARQVLTERELKAWTWVVLENFTSAEAALGLDCTPAAVRSLLLRSRAKLQEAMDRSGA